MKVSVVDETQEKVKFAKYENWPVYTQYFPGRLYNIKNARYQL